MTHVENIILKKEDQIYLDHLKNKNIINARMCDRHLEKQDTHDKIKAQQIRECKQGKLFKI